MKCLLTCPSDGPNGGDGDALPAAMNVRRKPLNCLAAILKLLQNHSQATSGQLHFSRSQCLPSSFPPMRAAWLSLSTPALYKSESSTRRTRDARSFGVPLEFSVPRVSLACACILPAPSLSPKLEVTRSARR
mgnify:CR=1 FL=1